MTKNRSLVLTSLGVDVGSKTHLVKTVTEADTLHFAEMSADFSPVHIGSDFVKKRLLGQNCPCEAGRGINTRGCR